MRSTLITALMTGIAATGWLAYTAYTEHDASEQLETDRRVAEIEQQRKDRTTDDVIQQLEQTPAWNGPGNPAFGVGDDTP